MPTFVTTIVTARDASTHAVIAGAKVFISGIGRGSTNVSGQISLTLPTGSMNDLSIKAANYTDFSATISSDAEFLANLASTIVPSTFTFHLIIWPEAPAQGVSFVFSNGINPVNANYVVGGVDVTGLTAGDQIITGSVPGFVDVNQTFTIPAVLSGTIQLTASKDEGRQNKQMTEVTQDPSVDSILPSLTPEDSPEFVASNTGQGTYFTMTQARMYIGDLFIDELNALQFVLQDNKIPIYGYASRFYDSMAQGKSLVQGQFTINFISEGYLVTALREYSHKLSLSTDVPTDSVKKSQQDRLLFLVNKLQNPDPAWTPLMIKSAVTEINNLAGSLGPASVDAAKQNISLNKKQQDNSILGLAGGDYPNAVYEDVPFDVVVEYQGAGRTITRRLEDCHLISNESIMDHSGMPITESYGFIARRLR